MQKIKLTKEIPDLETLTREAESYYKRKGLEYEAIRNYARHQYTSWDGFWKARQKTSKNPSQTYWDLKIMTNENLDAILWPQWIASKPEWGGW